MRSKKLLLLPVGLALVVILFALGAVGQAGSPVVAALLPEAGDGPDSARAELTVCNLGPPACDYALIQDAVNAAQPGDTIKVAGGVYNEVNTQGQLSQVLHISKTVTLRGGYVYPDWSQPGLLPSVIDAQTEGRAVYITGDVSPTLEYLHITGGEATWLGGGAYAYDGAGGGIYVVSATATIKDCFIYDNLATRFGWGAGGGIYLHNSQATVASNVVMSNTSSLSMPESHAAGQSRPAARAGSRAFFAGEGGGIAVSGGNAVLVDNLIEFNIAAGSGPGGGGGIFMEIGSPLLRRNIVRDNMASADDVGLGGGVFNGDASYAQMVNNVLMENFSGPVGGSSGGGLAAEYGSPQLFHTTIYSNTGFDGSGIWVSGEGTTVWLTNTILANQMLGITTTASNSAILDSVLFDNVVDYGGTGWISATNVISGSPGLAADGYHLLDDSPAIDAGVPAGVADDIDGQLRPYGLGADLGADEWVPPTTTQTIDPITGGTLVYTDTRGLKTIVEVPPGAVTETVYLLYESVLSLTVPSLPDLSYVGPGFHLTAYVELEEPLRTYLPLVQRGYSWPVALPPADLQATAGPAVVSRPAPDAFGVSAVLVPIELDFSKPVTVTVQYADEDLVGILDESSLRLYYWENPDWLDTAGTCSPPSTYIRNLTKNELGVAICHLTEFGIQGE